VTYLPVAPMVLVVALLTGCAATDTGTPTQDHIEYMDGRYYKIPQQAKPGGVVPWATKRDGVVGGGGVLLTAIMWGAREAVRARKGQT